MNDGLQSFLEHVGKKGMKWGVVRANPKTKGRTLKDQAKDAKNYTLKEKVKRNQKSNLAETITAQKGSTLRNKIKAQKVKPGDKVYINKKQATDLVKKELNVRPGNKGLTRSGKPKGITLKTKIKNSRDLPLLNEIRNQQGVTLKKKVKKAEKALGKKKYSSITISQPTIVNGRKFVADFEFKLNTKTGEIEQKAMSNNGQDFLEHVGKKGMRWGVRKASSTDSGSKKAAPKAAPKAKEKKAGKYTKAGKLSNKQLKESVDRMRLEKDYNALVAEKKSKSTGRRLLNRTLKTTEDVAFSALDVQGKRVASLVLGKQLDKTLGIESNLMTTAKDYVRSEKVRAAGKREAEDLVKKQNAPRSFIPPTGNSRKPPKGARRFKP